MKFLTLLFFVAGFCQIGSSQNYIGDQKDIDQILANIEKFSSYVMASDHEGIAASYTADGKIFPSDRDIIEGQGLKDYWKSPEGVSIPYHKITPVEIKIIGTDAYDYGYYEGKTKRANDEELSWKGKYVIIWRKVEGDWKIYLDIWNRIKE